MVFKCNKSRCSWKSIASHFDVATGSFNGSEICELAGLYIQSNVKNILPKIKFGLYLDDKLILLRNLNDQQMNKKRKAIIKVFKDIGFSIDIPANFKKVDFLTLHWTYNMLLLAHTGYLTISYFKFTLRRTIHRKSSNSYKFHHWNNVEKFL